ncbi:MAG: radical SAM protein [Nitrospirota bacterium]|nr:MAG: radical SAM protein [Nitrospirota bacterium]
MTSFPDYVQFYPTIRCNKSCDFCFNGGLHEMEDMHVTKMMMMVDKLKGIGTRTIDIMGGEPTLHKDLAIFVSYAMDKAMGINISSNGSGNGLLNSIQDSCPDALIGISINSREDITKAADSVRQKGLLVKTVVGRNKDETMLSDILSMGATATNLIYMDEMAPDGIGATLPFDEFYFWIREAFGGNGAAPVFCSGFLPDTDTYPSLRNKRCPAGTTKVGIMPDGSVYPCNLFFGFPEFRIGNIFTSSFDEIWGNEILSFFRDFDGNLCPRKDCRLHAMCHGGCPAHSYSHFGDLAAPEPRCVTMSQ